MAVVPPSNRSLLYLRLPNWLGDACMSLPIIESLLARPEYDLVICARGWAKQLLRHYPIPHWVILNGQLLHDAQAVRKHRQQHRHQAARGLIIPDSFSSAFVFWWAGIAAAGVKDEGRRFLLRWPLDKPPLSLHTVPYWYQIAYQSLQLWQTPIPKAPGPLSLRLNPNLALPTGYPQSNDCMESEQRTVLIAPTAVGKHKGQIKVWPHFEALTQALQKKGIRVVMCPPNSEAEQARQNAPSAEQLEALPIDQFAQLCRSVDLVVCNDSGVSHLAAAAQATQITLFGVTSASRTGPWSPQANIMGQHGQWPNLEQVLQKCLLLLALNERETA